MFPSRREISFHFLGAEMVKYSASVDGVKENGGGPVRAIRDRECRIGEYHATARKEDHTGREALKACALHLLSFGGAVGSTSAVVIAKLGVYSMSDPV